MKHKEYIPEPEICDTCGCRALTKTSRYGLVFDECSLCGSISGSPETLDELEQLEWARETGTSGEMLPLLNALSKIRGFKLVSITNPDTTCGVMPGVYFQLPPSCYGYFEKLQRLVESWKSGEMAWHIEASSLGGASFWLRPEPGFDPLTHKPSAGEVNAAVKSASKLADEITKNVKLQWWEA